MTLVQKVCQLANDLPAPSVFARSEEWAKKVTALKMKVHRPCSTNVGPHITLFYDFDIFLCLDEVALEDKDTEFALKFVTAMAYNYSLETHRRDEVLGLLEKYVEYRIPSVENTDGAILACDGRPCFIIEFKNEVGKGACDSFMELIAYCTKLTARAAIPCPGPGLLVEVVGPHMNIYGFAWSDTVLVDKLAGLWLTHQQNCKHTMNIIAKVLKALKVTVKKLVDMSVTNTPESCFFPYFTSFKLDEEDTEIKFEYKDEMKLHVYRATTTTENDLVVKFTESYCKEAHEIMARSQHAPKLLCFKKVNALFYMVVMEYIRDAIPLYEYVTTHGKSKEQVLDLCMTALDNLHKEGYCHGDFRPNNILVTGSEQSLQVKVVDFDWAGKIGEVKYPTYMSEAIIWPDGASDGSLITKDHDLHWIRKLRN